MSIKGFVNNPYYSSYVEELDEWIKKEHKTLESTQDIDTIRKAQGAVQVLRRLKTLREIVNGRD